MLTARRSFIREILKVTSRPEVISFAGGVPNPALFPVEGIAAVAAKVLAEQGREALQYSTTEGYPPLREYIARRYTARGLSVDPADILIVNGSQQGLDLVGKAFLDPGDRVVMERPGYLGAIQAFSVFEPSFVQVPMDAHGIDPAQLGRALDEHAPKLFYAVPNFQNPSGITYSRERRRAVAELLNARSAVLVEDDPYAELRFIGEHLPPLRSFVTAPVVLMGSFSKIVAPGLRLGWVYAPRDIMDKLVIAKQAADLHANILAQMIVHRHLMEHDLDAYLVSVRAAYRRQREAMVAAMHAHFPPGVSYTEPEGGMFLWVTLPAGCSATRLLEEALAENVAFVPGSAFYADGGGEDALRLNYTASDEARITEGIRRLGRVIERHCAVQGATR